MLASWTEWTVAATESAAVATIAAATHARCAWLLRTSFVDDQRTAVERLSIEAFNCFCCIVNVLHLDETEAFRHAGELVCDNSHRSDRSIRRKQLMELFFSCAERQASNIQFFIGHLVHTSPKMLSLKYLD